MCRSFNLILQDRKLDLICSDTADIHGPDSRHSKKSGKLPLHTRMTEIRWGSRLLSARPGSPGWSPVLQSWRQTEPLPMLLTP